MSKEFYDVGAIQQRIFSCKNIMFLLLKADLEVQLKEVLGSIRLSERGVFVQASTLGSLEALLEFLRTSKIPVLNLSFKNKGRKLLCCFSMF